LATYYYAQSIGGDEVAYLAPSYRAKIKKSAFWSKLPSNVTLRILGTGPNADLIVESAGHLLVGHIAGLELHGPRGIPANAELDTLLECSSKFPPLARSLGGMLIRSAITLLIYLHRSGQRRILCLSA